MQNLHRPRFSFVANSATEGDESGVASWEVAVWYRGDWVTESFKIALPSFKTAHRLNEILAAAWAGGEATGFANLQSKILEALK